MKAPAPLAVFTASLLSHATAATVYINDAVIDDPVNITTLNSPGWTVYDRVFTLTQSINGFLVAEVTSPDSESFLFTPLSIAGGYNLYKVNAGQEFTYLNAGSNVSLISWGPPVNYLTLASGQSAYIGYWSQQLSDSQMRPTDLFGWAKVTVSGGELIVEESASTQGGIIVGTTIAVPEPSSLLLISAAALPLLRRRRASDI